MSKKENPPEKCNISEDVLQQSFLDTLQKFPKGLTDIDIQISLPELVPEKRVQIVNNLLSQNKIILCNQGGKLIYRYNSATNGQSSKGADSEEKIVLNIIEEAGNKGIWMRDIRIKSNLTLTQLNKVLKALEGKKLIKAVKSVAASRKKVYMLFNLEPDKSVTGGAWYSDQDFEAEFVTVLSQQCYRFLVQRRDRIQTNQCGPYEARNQSYASSKDVWKFISELGISKVALTVEDIETILEMIVYDGKVEKVVCADLSKRYRAIEPLLPPPGLVMSCCGVCPVIRNCSDLGDVTPQKCQYIRDWLNI